MFALDLSSELGPGVTPVAAPATSARARSSRDALTLDARGAQCHTARIAMIAIEKPRLTAIQCGREATPGIAGAAARRKRSRRMRAKPAAITDPPPSAVVVGFVSLTSTVGPVGTGGTGSSKSSVGMRSGIVRNVASPAPPPAANHALWAFVSGIVCRAIES
jgi:hypothetical protein